MHNKTNCGSLQVICLGLTGQDCQTTYVVQSGDTCAGIAGNYNITQSTLLDNNPNLNQICTNLYPNEVWPLLALVIGVLLIGPQVLCVSSTVYVNLTQSS